MSQDKERVAVEEDKEDRISVLPRDIIDHILELLPVQDAARTSALSKKWRTFWSMLPCIVLDYDFCYDVKKQSQSSFIQIVDGILLLHRGDIVKFVLEAPQGLLLSYTDIDRWMFHLTRNGVKELIISVPVENDTSSIYKLPSYVFNWTTLTYLGLGNCLFEPPNSFLSFPKLETLYLEGTTIAPTTEFCVLNVPRLVYLYLIHSDGTQYLSIVSPLLEELWVHNCHYLVLNCFMNCKKVRDLFLRIIRMGDNTKQCVSSTLEKLLFSLAPTVEKLSLDSLILELFSVGRIPKGPLFMFNCLWSLSLKFDFGELSPTSGALQLIKSVLGLSELEIVVKTTCDNAEAVLEYLNTPACLDQPLNKLKQVDICWFQGSEVELLFTKLLLARTPSLVRMNIELLCPFSKEVKIITPKLRSFKKVSPKAELFIY